MYACARGGTLNLVTSSVETSTTGSGQWQSNKPQKHSWGATIDGIVNLDEPGLLTLADLQAKQIAFEEILVNFEMTDLDGNVYGRQGIAFIINSSDTGNINDVATFSIELLGTGQLQQIYTPTPLPLSAVDSLYRTAIGGGNTISFSGWADVDMLGVTKDGVDFEVIETGTPASKQVLYTTSAGTGILEFAIPLEAGEVIHTLSQSIM